MENPIPSTHILDPTGDRFLVVNKAQSQQTFRVSGKAMCLASPVWRAILGLAILCDKYDTARFLLPWFKLHWKPKFSKYAQEEGKECSLLIAWVSLDEATFQNLAVRLVTQSLVDNEDKFDIDFRQILETCMPLGMID